MASIDPNRDRKVIPRWRPFHTTVNLGQMDSEKTPRETKPGEDFLYSKLQEWRARRTAIHASDLVGSAIVLGREKEVEDAAEYLVKMGSDISQWAKELAGVVFSSRQREEDKLETPPRTRKSDLGEQIRKLRSLLRSEPRDAVLWVDLARVYCALGLSSKAEKCMEVGLGLAPDNRFVLRCASRFWIHLDNPEKAHDIIVRSNRTKHDPWLLSAEIATGGAAGRNSRLLRSALRILAAREVAPAHLSELASAVATVELGTGLNKKVRKLFDLSLEEPTENSIAQAEWVSRRENSMAFDTRLVQRPDVHEAAARISFKDGEWKTAAEKCRFWHFDQPFSSRPAIFGSFISATALEDYVLSKDFAEAGLLGNPSDPTLRNNLAFALINLGNTDLGERELSKIDEGAATSEDRVVIKATRGLLKFRTGRPEVGRKLYLEARDEAKKGKNLVLLKRLMAFHCLEEIVQVDRSGMAFVAEALDALSDESDPTFGLLRNRLMRAARKIP